MKSKSKFRLWFLLLFFSLETAYASDLEQVVSGAEVEDSLAKVKSSDETDPYIIKPEATDLEKIKIKKNAGADFNFTKTSEEVTVTNEPRKRLEDIGYTPPGSFENKENYIELDKKQMASEFRTQSSGALNLTFIKNNFSYESQNDIINRTIGEGYKHVKGGALYVRSDQYFFRRDMLNSFWCLGAGVGFNSGRGFFVTGDRSDTTFRLWEIPVDAGLGLEIPLYHWFKVAAAAGPSVTALYQNRNDFQQGEKGKNKIQVSYGQFANAQFKFNLSGFSDETAYDLFSQSKITNLLLNLEVRYQNYQNFQDDIKISGTSFGIGFTFEYL